MSRKPSVLTLSLLLVIALCQSANAAGALKTHGIFSSSMVIQRSKPISIWGWAEPGAKVSVSFGVEKAQADADPKSGRWEATFPARETDASGLKLTVTSGDEKIEMENILIGDIWVMNGQSEMAFGLGKTSQADLETAQAHLPLLRQLRISPNEKATLQTDLPETVTNGGWVVADPKTAGGFSSIGYSFGSRLQRALRIPIGVIDNARGGASIESLVPLRKFDDHPVAAAYKAHLDQRIAEFDAEKLVEQKWQNRIARLRSRGTRGLRRHFN